MSFAIAQTFTPSMQTPSRPPEYTCRRMKRAHHERKHGEKIKVAGKNMEKLKVVVKNINSCTIAPHVYLI